MTQSDKWLQIYGREKAKLMVAVSKALLVWLCQNQVTFQRKGSRLISQTTFHIELKLRLID